MRAMCGVQLKERKISSNLIFMLSLSKTMDQLLWQTVFIGMVVY